MEMPEPPAPRRPRRPRTAIVERVERLTPREALSVSGYWKRSRTEEGWREDKAE